MSQVFKDRLLQIWARATGCYVASTSAVWSGKTDPGIEEMFPVEAAKQMFPESYFLFWHLMVWFWFVLFFYQNIPGDLVKPISLQIYHDIFGFSILISVEGGVEKVNAITTALCLVGVSYLDQYQK